MLAFGQSFLPSLAILKRSLNYKLRLRLRWPFVKACYHLKDGPLAFDCYEVIDQVIAPVAAENTPNVRVLAESLTKQSRSYPFHEQ